MQHSSKRHIISPLLTKVLGMKPLKDYAVLPSGATRLIDAHSSFYVLPIDDEQKQFILIDAGNDKKGKALLDFLRQHNVGLAAVRAVFLTHAHSDHVGALHVLPVDTLVYISNVDSKTLHGDVSSEGPLPSLIDKVSRKHAAAVPKVTPTIIADNQSVSIGDLSIKALTMTGHTSGSTGYLIRRGDATVSSDFFVGDAVDFKRNGNAVSAAPPFTKDTKQSAQSIVVATKRIQDDNILVSAVIPAHSGDGTFESLALFKV